MIQNLPIQQSEISLHLPPALVDLGESAQRAFLEFFTAQIRNKNTRQAYLRNVCRFLDWIESRGATLPDIQAMHIALYIEQLGKPKSARGWGYSAPTVKQHLAALRVFGAFLVIRQIVPTNPAADVRGPKHIVTTGKTPVMAGEDAKALFTSIDISKPSGLRDKALLGVMVYTFARVSAVCALELSDYYQVGRRMMFQFQEKGGRHHVMPAHHTAIEYLDAYIEGLGEKEGPLFRSVNRTRTGFTDRRLDRREALAMVKRRCKAAGLGDRFTNHTFRATGITAYLKNEGQLEHAQYMASHASPRTTKLYDRRAQEASLDEVERIIL
ncbi:MAG: tyrosine-type recombinase/integrase [bacterium]